MHNQSSCVYPPLSILILHGYFYFFQIILKYLNFLLSGGKCHIIFSFAFASSIIPTLFIRQWMIQPHHTSFSQHYLSLFQQNRSKYRVSISTALVFCLFLFAVFFKIPDAQNPIPILVLLRYYLLFRAQSKCFWLPWLYIMYLILIRSRR